MHIPEIQQKGRPLNDSGDAWPQIQSAFAEQCPQKKLCVELVRVFVDNTGEEPCAYSSMDAEQGDVMTKGQRITLFGQAPCDVTLPPPGEDPPADDPPESGPADAPAAP
ncbi:hypothetical protein ACFYWS_32830 [Streptomyces sp. NPDC002795]|uniref:hypothetical protein n=1 Tax=Streptomyces sp. NPDC002795 TaxID=3364665 RepID=UPI00367F0532